MWEKIEDGEKIVLRGHRAQGAGRKVGRLTTEGHGVAQDTECYLIKSLPFKK